MTYAPLIAGFIVLFLVEFLYPAKKPNWRGFVTTFTIACFAMVVSQWLAQFPGALVGVVINHARNEFWPIHLNMRVFAWWFDGMPNPIGYKPSLTAAILFTLTGLLVIDFFYYWYHRLQHSTFLWHIHKVHHTDKHMTAATSYRHHVLEFPLQALLLILPMSLVFSLTQIFTFALIVKFHALFVHLNLRLNLGPLTPLVVGPQYHRIHHSINEEHRNKNFAMYFPIWDVLFGTYQKPQKDEFPDTGVEGENPHSLKRVVWF